MIKQTTGDLLYVLNLNKEGRLRQIAVFKEEVDAITQDLERGAYIQTSTSGISRPYLHDKDYGRYAVDPDIFTYLRLTEVINVGRSITTKRGIVITRWVMVSIG